MGIDLTKFRVAGMMYNGFAKSSKYQHAQSMTLIGITREFVLLASSCMKPYVDFLITSSKFWILKLAYIALALHRQGKFRTRR